MRINLHPNIPHYFSDTQGLCRGLEIVSTSCKLPRLLPMASFETLFAAWLFGVLATACCASEAKGNDFVSQVSGKPRGAAQGRLLRFLEPGSEHAANPITPSLSDRQAFETEGAGASLLPPFSFSGSFVLLCRMHHSMDIHLNVVQGQVPRCHLWAPTDLRVLKQLSRLSGFTCHNHHSLLQHFESVVLLHSSILSNAS